MEHGGTMFMYRIIKVLNNNGILVYDDHTGREMILLGNGVGFGKRPAQQIGSLPGAKVYTLVNRQKQHSVLQVVNGIRPEFIEAAGRIIDEADKMFQNVSRDILLPMADHIALAAKRAAEGRQIPNPFTPDIRVLFEKEYAAALKGREIIRELAGCEISDDEVGFITLHIHAGLSDEQVSEALETTRIIDEGSVMIEKAFGQEVENLYYMIARTRKGESTKADFNEFIFANYPYTGQVAEEICAHMSRQLKKEVAREEIGFLAIHIQRVVDPDAV